MAKWVRFEKDIWVNVAQIRHITQEFGEVFIDSFLVKRCISAKEAEKFIKDFIAEHYIQTEKIG